MAAVEARYAIYFVPGPNEVLARFGRQVLGYDADTGETLPPPRELTDAFADWSRLVDGPSRYGFHATLKAPFRLRDGKSEPELLSEVEALARDLPEVPLGRLSPEMLGRFVALRPLTYPPELVELERRIVTMLEKFRAPLVAQERERREPHRLSSRQRALLEQYGYPHCLDEFRFHMTLAGPLDDFARDRAVAVLRSIYLSFDEPCRLQNIAVVRQATAGVRFRVIGRFPLGGAAHVGVFNRSFILSHR